MADRSADLPTTVQLRMELQRVKYRTNYNRVLRSTVFTLVSVAAVAILVATLWLPVLQIYGNSMEPSLKEGDIVVSVKESDLKTGDVVAFYLANKVLVKRVIGNSGDWIDIKADGSVYVNNQKIEEPYLQERAFGTCDIELPYQVPEGRVFVMGDNRSLSLDSRSKTVGCISEEQIVGKLTYVALPFSRMGAVK